MATEPMLISIPQPDTSSLQLLVSRTSIAVDSLVVENEEQYSSAADLLKLIAEQRSTSYNFLDKSIKLAHDAHKSLTTDRGRLVAPWDALRVKVESVMKKFRLGQQAQLDAQRREQDRRAKELLDASSAEAAKLKQQGNFAKAREIVQQAETVVAHGQQMIAEPERVKGVRESETWTGVCDDPLALMKAVVAGRIQLLHTVKVAGKEREEPLFTVNQRVLDMMADRLRKDWAWPGCSSKKDLNFGVSKGG